jgi:hypothetical protein
MAKKASVNKSQAIRDALAANPDKSPSEIATLLTAEGLKVNAQYVSTIKSNANAKARGGRRTVMRRKPMGGGRIGGSNMSAIDAALELIKAAGGLDQAMHILTTVEEIRRAI